MSAFLRSQLLTAAGWTMLVAGGNLPAQTSQPALNFQDGLTLSLPANWNVDVADPMAPNRDKPPAYEDPDTLKLLLHAKPGEAQRNASLTVLRDETAGGHSGPAAKQEMMARLNEIVVAAGYRPERFVGKGDANTPNNVLEADIVGVSGDGKRRTFGCLVLNRYPQPSLRCYWQYDDEDAASLHDVQQWLSSTLLGGVKVTDALSGAPTVALASKPTAPAPGLSSEAQAVTGAPPSGQTGDLVAKDRAALVMIEGDEGKGSGFVASFDGKPYLVTNIHVLAGNPNPHFTTIDGRSLQGGAAALAVNHDICKIELPNAPNALEVMQNVDANVKVGDAITVLGNAEGSGVVRPFEGHVVGIGPNLVEVDAPFVPGNSGSPIIHQATGKVIGIATYLEIRKVTPGSGNSGPNSNNGGNNGYGNNNGPYGNNNSQNGSNRNRVDLTVRRFGYRLDSAKAWEPVIWPKFYTQATQAKQIEDTSKEFIKLFEAEKWSARDFSNREITRAISTLEEKLTSSRRMSSADLMSARRELMSNLKYAATSDISRFDNRTAYDYFRREVADEKAFRDQVCAALEKDIDASN